MLSELIPWHEQEKIYAPQINGTIGYLAKAVKRIAIISLYIKQRLGLTDKATIPNQGESLHAILLRLNCLLV